MNETKAGRLAMFVQRLAHFEVRDRYGACYSHMGATICDSILQAGLNYRFVVAPRINSLMQRWPTARFTSSFCRLIDRYGIHRVLNWKDIEKPRRIVEVTHFLLEKQIETESHLKDWLLIDSNHDVLQGIRGVGNKTIDYLKSLVGLPAIAVDRHVRTFISWAGMFETKYDEVRDIVSRTADLLGYDRSGFDHAIWNYVSIHGVPIFSDSLHKAA